MYDFKSFYNNVEGTEHKTVKVALQIRFSESGIQEVAAPHSKKLMNKEIILLDEGQRKMIMAVKQ
jgi:hypothetical protein